MEELNISLLLNTVKILVTLLCIYIINLPRQQSSGSVHPVSLSLIGVAACLFMIVTVTLSPLVISEPENIAGNVMLGLVILGIIVILKNQVNAESILSVVLVLISGGMGMAIGIGLFMEAIMVALLTYFLLNLFLRNKPADFKK